MIDDASISSENGNELLAAEYVLGVLSPSARRAVERKRAQDPGFAAQLSFWETRLGGLSDEVPPVAPSQAVWARIAAELGPALTKERGGLWQDLAFWRTLAISSAALAAASIAGLIYVGQLPSQAPSLLARLDAESGQASFVAAVSRGGDSVTIVPASLLAPEQQKALELWLIPPGDKPHSLGLIDPSRPVQIRVPKSLLPRLGPDAVLAVSVEAPGGSQTGQPTGPVIADGKLSSL